MTVYLILVLLYLTLPPFLLFLASEVSYLRCGKRLGYFFVSILWLFCVSAFVYVGYAQMSLGCRSILGDCYVDGITFSFMFWKDVLSFGYLAVVILSGLHLLFQVVKWAIDFICRYPGNEKEGA